MHHDRTNAFGRSASPGDSPSSRRPTDSSLLRQARASKPAALSPAAGPFVEEEPSPVRHPVTFGDYAREWIDSYTGRTSRGLDSSTRGDYRTALRLHLMPRLGGLELARITPRDIRALIAHLEEEGCAPSSIRKHLVPMKALFATAIEDGLMTRNPAATVRVASRRDDWEIAEQRVLTSSEQTAFLDAVDPDWRVFFELLLQTGVRVSEAAGLRWEDITESDPAVLRVRRQVRRGKVKPPKTRYGRRDIPLSSRLKTALREHRNTSAYPELQDPIFTTSTGSCLDVSNLRKNVLAPATARAGTGQIGFHTFRHTCASLLFAGGKDLKQVQRWLGHHDPAFTLSTYIHLLEGGLGDAELFAATEE